MANFCGKCSAKLDSATGLCPNCDAKKESDTHNAKKMHKASTTAEKKALQKKKRAQWSTAKKIRSFLLKLILTMLLLIMLSVGMTGILVYFDVVNVPFLSYFNQNGLLQFINQRNIIIEEENIIMTSQTEGTATIIVTLPDYELLFENAVTAKNPDNYLLKALILKDYKTQEFEVSASVTVENGKKVVHSDEVIHQLLEESLVNAISALVEVE